MITRPRLRKAVIGDFRILLFAVNALAAFVLFLRLDGQRGDRARFQALERLLLMVAPGHSPPIGRSPTLLVLACAALAFIGGSVERTAAQSNNIDEAVSAHGVSPKLELTPAQRSAIYQEVHKDKSKVAPSRFAIDVDADVPPMIEL